MKYNKYVLFLFFILMAFALIKTSPKKVIKNTYKKEVFYKNLTVNTHKKRQAKNHKRKFYRNLASIKNNITNTKFPKDIQFQDQVNEINHTFSTNYLSLLETEPASGKKMYKVVKSEKYSKLLPLAKNKQNHRIGFLSGLMTIISSKENIQNLKSSLDNEFIKIIKTKSVLDKYFLYISYEKISQISLIKEIVKQHQSQVQIDVVYPKM